jgi:hypothetical protein
MRVALDDERWACDPHEPQWLAPAYQWAALLDELRAWERDNPGGGPHPLTCDLEARYSRSIPGSTCTAQAEIVQRWHDAAQRDPRVLRDVAFGVRTPAAIEHAVGARATDGSWEERLTAAAADFPGSDWARGQLRSFTVEAQQ